MHLFPACLSSLLDFAAVLHTRFNFREPLGSLSSGQGNSTNQIVETKPSNEQCLVPGMRPGHHNTSVLLAIERFPHKHCW